MAQHKPVRRLLAMALSVAMVLGMLPVTAAAESLPNGTSGEIVSFEPLPEATAAQTVALGTPLEALNLPETLTAAVRLEACANEPVRDSGNAIQQEADEVKQQEQEEPVSIVDSGEPGEEEFDAGYTETGVSVPVTWTASPDYDGDTAGVYVFTAEAEDFTLSAKAPTITVTVGQAAVKGTITAFDELTEDLRWQNTAEPVFPETLTGTVEGQSTQIPVTWEADHDYDAGSPATGLYVFTAKPGEGYALASGVEAPRITVYIPAAKRMMLRMAGNGTSESPLEITSAAQLAEIAVLVNEGGGWKIFW